jgi:hypothetical protein
MNFKNGGFIYFIGVIPKAAILKHVLPNHTYWVCGIHDFFY